MKKNFTLLVIIIAGIFIAGCAMDRIFYCPYCGSANISAVKDEPGVYKCGREGCEKKFGAKEIKEETE
jgi:transcription elongation factor Elf1